MTMNLFRALSGRKAMDYDTMTQFQCSGWLDNKMLMGMIVGWR